MNTSLITRYIEPEKPTAITPYIEVYQPEPIHQEWTNFVSQKTVKAIAISPQSQKIWLATWGGVISWQPKTESFYCRYSSEHGLGGNAITSLGLDHQELPWVGNTEGGLSYFNSKDWQIYPHLQNICIRVITSAVNQPGIWAASQNTVYYISGSDQHPQIIAQDHLGAVEALTLLAEDNNLLLGNSWGLFRLQKDQKPVALSPDEINNCTALARDTNNNLWLGTNQGICKLSGENFSKILLFELGNRVIALVAGKRIIYGLTDDGKLFQIIDDQLSYIIPKQKMPHIRAIGLGKDNSSLWLGTDNFLARVYCSNSQEAIWDFEPDILPHHSDDKITNLGRSLVIRNEQVWIATARGLLHCNKNLNTTKSMTNWTMDMPKGLENLSPRSIISANDILWLLTWPEGIYQLDSSNGLKPLETRQIKGLPQLLVTSQDGCLHILTGRGLWQYQRDESIKKVSPHLPALIKCLVQTPNGNWWLGTIQGLYRLRHSQWEFVGTQPGPLQAEVHALKVIDSVLWVATENGLWGYQYQDDIWTFYNLENNPDHVAVWALAPGQDGNIWIASELGVCDYRPKTQTIGVKYTLTNSGLASKKVVALGQIAQTLWIVTQVGISCLQLNYTQKDKE